MKYFKKLVIIILIVCLTGCNSKNSAVRSYHVYTAYPIGYLLERIGGNRIMISSIQNSAHIQNATLVDDYENILDNALYFYYIKGLEPYLDLYGDDIDESLVNEVDLSTSSIYAFKRYTPVKVGGTLSYVESDYYSGSAFDDIDTYTNDLYLWLNPIGMLSMAKQIYNNLTANYAEQSSYFTDNYQELENDLISLDAAYQNLATSLQNEGKTIKFVSLTPSFTSWQKAYGIEVYPVCLSKYGALPTDSQLEIIKQRIIDDGVEYIVYEPNMSDEMMSLFSSLESELGLKRVNLSNISSLTVTQQSDNKDYLTIMYENLAVLENIAISIDEEDTGTEQ